MTLTFHIVPIHEIPEAIAKEHLVALRREAGYGEDDIPHWISTSRDGTACYVMAYTDNPHSDHTVYSNLIGTIGVTWVDSEGDPALGNREEGIIQLSSLAVAERWRGKGLAHQLMLIGEKLARERGAKKIVSYTDYENVLSFKVHEHAGYRMCGTTKRVWAGTGPPAVCFEKTL
ncbi:acyl-CoA N-acyltransferase [Cladochytrium replicatum]|nr:acyl-CoA N-acyltransferase [Cladochytrium replicatum]